MPPAEDMGSQERPLSPVATFTLGLAEKITPFQFHLRIRLVFIQEIGLCSVPFLKTKHLWQQKQCVAAFLKPVFRAVSAMMASSGSVRGQCLRIECMSGHLSFNTAELWAPFWTKAWRQLEE